MRRSSYHLVIDSVIRLRTLSSLSGFRYRFFCDDFFGSVHRLVPRKESKRMSKKHTLGKPSSNVHMIVIVNHTKALIQQYSISLAILIPLLL